jgi:3D (Asp-Asp-Asp) domain-containing protein
MILGMIGVIFCLLHPRPAATKAFQAARTSMPIAVGRAMQPVPLPARPATRPAQPQTMRMLVTVYCPCALCCGACADGQTASGKSIHHHASLFVAADTRVLPFGVNVSVPGYYDGLPVPVLDRGSRIKGNRLDVFFLSHERARRWGRKWLAVTVHRSQ